MRWTLVCLLAACGAGSASESERTRTSTDEDGGDDDGYSGVEAGPGLENAGIGHGGLATYGCEQGGAGFLYVDGDAAGPGIGTKGEPFQTIQAAFVALTDDSAICVARASTPYVEHIGTATLSDTTSEHVVFVGGFDDTFTTRSGEALSQVQAPTRSQGVFRFGDIASLVIDGFEISGGAAGIEIGGWSAGRVLSLKNNWVHDNGVEITSATDLPDGYDSADIGGVRASGTTLTLEHNLIEDNLGGRGGAGVFIAQGASSDENERMGDALTISSALATLRYNVIRNNTCAWDTPHGAGLSLNMNALVDHNVFIGNVGKKWAQAGGEGVGGGLIAQFPNATVEVSNNWFEGNRADKAGAAVFIDEASIGTIYNNVIVGNVGDGAIFVDGRASGDDDRAYATIVNNTIAGNSNGGLSVQDSTVSVYFNIMWNNGRAADIEAWTGGDLIEVVQAHHNVMAGTYPSDATWHVSDARDHEASSPFAAAEDYRLAMSVTHDDASVVPAYACSNALTSSPSVGLDGLPHVTAEAIVFGAYGATAP